MSSNNHRHRARALSAALSLGVAGAVFAQTATEVGDQLANNQAALHDYTWHRATTAKLDGDVVSETTERLFYDIDGTIQSDGHAIPTAPTRGSAGELGAATQHGSAGAGPQRGRKKGRGKGSSSAKAAQKASKEQEKTMELIDDVSDAALSYGVFDPERMKAFLESASITSGDGVVKIQGKGFSDKKDALTLELDSTSMALQRLEAQGELDGKPLTVTAIYQDVLNGPAALQRLVAEYPKEELRIEIEDSGFHRADGSRGAAAQGELPARRRRRPQR